MTTKTRPMKFVFCFALLLALLPALLLAMLSSAQKSYAQETKTGASGLPIPRFVSLKAQRVNMRVGPGQTYQVLWLYTKSGIPMEVVQEFDNWRRVRDVDGTEGWVFHSLLSGQRTTIVTPWLRDKSPSTYLSLYTKPDETSALVAQLEPGVVAVIKECNGSHCNISVDDVSGWVTQDALWGAYPNEVFK